MSFALTQAIGIKIGATLHNAFGVVRTCEYSAYLNFGFAAILCIANCGPFVFSENRKFNARIEELGRTDASEASSAWTLKKRSHRFKTFKGHVLNQNTAVNAKINMLSSYKAKISMHERANYSSKRP